MILATLLSLAALSSGGPFDLDDSLFEPIVLSGQSITVEWPANQCETGEPLNLEPTLVYEDYAEEEPVDDSLIDYEDTFLDDGEDWFDEPVVELMPWRARYYENGGEFWHDERCLPVDAHVEFVEPMGTTP